MRFQISHDPSPCRRNTLTCHDRCVRGSPSAPLVVTTRLSEPIPDVTAGVAVNVDGIDAQFHGDDAGG
jgi:hypothetical protein